MRLQSLPLRVFDPDELAKRRAVDPYAQPVMYVTESVFDMDMVYGVQKVGGFSRIYFSGNTVADIQLPYKVMVDLWESRKCMTGCPPLAAGFGPPTRGKEPEPPKPITDEDIKRIIDGEKEGL